MSEPRNLCYLNDEKLKEERESTKDKMLIDLKPELLMKFINFFFDICKLPLNQKILKKNLLPFRKYMMGIRKDGALIAQGFLHIVGVLQVY